MSSGQKEYGTNELARLGEALHDYSSQSATVTPPEQVGPYRVLAAIAEGGMGSVYQAEQTAPVRRTVALKLIKPGLDSREVLARFDAERQALARMDHPNIAKVLDAGADNLGRPYFVMEYVPGTPITRFCDENEIGLRQRLELFCQVCEAIAHAHTKAIIHRDIKSSNVLAYFQDGKPVVKVIDFGVAKAIRGDRLIDNTFSTNNGSIIGTYESMSPEQADGSRDIDTRTDVYSLGVLLYELLAGAKPFDSNTLSSVPDHEVRRIIREVEPPKPSARVLQRAGSEGDRSRTLAARSLALQLQGELEWIPLRAMRKERERRYASALAIAQDVRNFLAGRPLAAGPESRLYVAKKFIRRNKGPVIAVAAIVVLCIVGGAMYVRGIRAEQARTLAALHEVERQKEDANRQRDIAEAVQAFLSDMIRAPKPEAAQGRPVLVEDVVLRAAERVGESFKDKPAVEATLRNTFADTFLSLGKLKLAEEQLQRALELRRSALGDDHNETLASMYNLGQTLAQLSRNREALPLLRESFDRLRRKNGPDDPYTLQAQNALAATLRNLEQLAEAEPLMRDVWERRKRLLGAENEATLVCETNLGGILRDAGRHEEAEAHYRHVLEGRQKLFGDDHPATISAMNNLASLLQLTGRTAEAEPMLREALERNRRVLGNEHPNTIGSIHNLASMLGKESRYAEAEPLLREAMELNLKTVGPDHRNTIRTQQVLGMLLLDTGRNLEAEQVTREALSRSERALGPAHSDTLRLLRNLVEILRRSDRSAEADALEQAGAARRGATTVPSTQTATTRPL
jgi:eukaryotic-like serine/threonine-protein kinase